MSTMLSLLFAAGVVAKEAATQAKAVATPSTLEKRRKTGVGAMLGFSSSGLSLRHQWNARVASQFSVYATLGQRFGVYSVGTQLQVVVNRHQTFRLYLAAPLKWKYTPQATTRQANFGPDSRVLHAHRLMFGLGLGLEVFFGPHVAMALELPVARWLHWAPRVTDSQDLHPDFWMIAPNTGIHVYFR